MVIVQSSLNTPGAPMSPTRTRRLHRLLSDDSGMSTVEYAIGCVAAAAFAAVLYAVVSGDSVVTALTQLVQRALTAGF
jgi:Flp pilus assembly pilin Flp